MRHIPRRPIAALAIGFSVTLAVLPDPALAQQQVAQPDSVQGDSVARDSTPPDIKPGSPHSPMMYLFIPVAVLGALVMAAVPASFALLEGPPDPSPLVIVEQHRAAYISVGGLFYDGETWAHSANFEMISNGVLAELKVEDFYRPNHFQYVTARAGYLFHPNTGSAGGVTLGYRYAHRDPTQAGLENRPAALPHDEGFARAPAVRADLRRFEAWFALELSLSERPVSAEHPPGSSVSPEW